MAVTLNVKGTSIPYFKIGKGGTTLYQGTSDPTGDYTVNSGDLWIDTSNRSISIYNSGWVSPKLGTVDVSTLAPLASPTFTGTLSTPALSVTNATSSSSTTTGALVVSGGVGVGGSLYANLVNAPTLVGALSGNATSATNLESGSAGTIPYQSASGTTAFTAVGSTGQVLTSNGTGTPTWTTPGGGGSGDSISQFLLMGA